MLFQKYLELGGRLLDFNLDPYFNNALDVINFVYLPQPNRRLLEFFVGRDCAPRYLASGGGQASLQHDRAEGWGEKGVCWGRVLKNGGQPFSPMVMDF